MDIPPSPPPWLPHLPAGQEVSRGAGQVEGARGLTAGWVRRWTDAPDRGVLWLAGEGWISGEALERRTRQRAGALERIGLRAGDRLVIEGATTPQLVITQVAALRLGLVVVPLNPAYRSREVAQVAASARPSLAVVHEVTAAIDVGSGGSLDVVRVQDLRDGDPTAPLDRAGPADPALMVFTSGTTGPPKGVPLTHGNLLASVEALALAWRWTPEDRLVLALPLFHLHGLGVGLYGTLSTGASAVILPSFDADAVLDAVGDHRATLFFGVPTMYQRLVDSGRVAELAPLRLCVSGSAPLSVDLHRLVATEGGQQILERYGMSETVMLVSNPYDGERRPGTVGYPLPGVSVRLDDTTGEIQVRGPNVFSGYWDRPEATAEAFEDGWFRTGDLGRHDADGYLTIIGRSKELIITGGYNVYPREVEDALRGVTGVEDVAVVGAPDAARGETVVAFVVGAPVLAELWATAEAELVPYKQPRRIHLVDALPRNALGKVVKADLHES